MEESSDIGPPPAVDEETEQFAVSIVRVWKRDDRLQMRVLNRTGLEPGDEHTSSIATTDIEVAIETIRSFITDFARGS